MRRGNAQNSASIQPIWTENTNNKSEWEKVKWNKNMDQQYRTNNSCFGRFFFCRCPSKWTQSIPTLCLFHNIIPHFFFCTFRFVIETPIFFSVICLTQSYIKIVTFILMRHAFCSALCMSGTRCDTMRWECYCVCVCVRLWVSCCRLIASRRLALSAARNRGRRCVPSSNAIDCEIFRFDTNFPKCQYYIKLMTLKTNWPTSP